MGTKKKQYSTEFKQEAVRLVQAGGRGASEIARSLGVSQSLLSRWVKAQREDGDEAFRGHGKRTAMDEEVWRLKLENKRLAMELEFLKKVSRYFAKDPQ